VCCVPINRAQQFLESGPGAATASGTVAVGGLTMVDRVTGRVKTTFCVWAGRERGEDMVRLQLSTERIWSEGLFRWPAFSAQLGPADQGCRFRKPGSGCFHKVQGRRWAAMARAR